MIFAIRLKLSNWLPKLSGHVSWGRLTIYGFNAMHVAVNFRTKRWGYICFHPPMYCFGTWWPWYFYVSPNATPWAASFTIGPGVDGREKKRSKQRRWIDVYRRMDQLRSDEFYQLRDYPESELDQGFARGLELLHDIVMGSIEFQCFECGKDRLLDSRGAGLLCPSCAADREET